MKKLLALALAMLLLVGCAVPAAEKVPEVQVEYPLPRLEFIEPAPAESESAAPADSDSRDESDSAPTVDSSSQSGDSSDSQSDVEPVDPSPAAEPPAESSPIDSAPADSAPPAESAAPGPAESAPAEPVPAEPVAAVTLPYGSVPFHLAEGGDQWWQIDATDECFWATAAAINAIRAETGLGELMVDGDLTAIAGSRCASFVSGGPFDHSGMVTASEICASGGPLATADIVCGYWKESPNHYAAITGDFTRMGIACWFYKDGAMQHTYWCVTFE